MTTKIVSVSVDQPLDVFVGSVLLTHHFKALPGINERGCLVGHDGDAIAHNGTHARLSAGFGNRRRLRPQQHPLGPHADPSASSATLVKTSSQAFSIAPRITSIGCAPESA